MDTIKVRKPRAPKFFGLAALYERYSRRWYTWQSSLPDNGEKIRLTWLPSPSNHPTTESAYVPCEGTVSGMDKSTGSFFLECKTSTLVCNRGSFDYTRTQ